MTAVLAPVFASGASAAWILVGSVLFLALYVYFSYCLMKMADLLQQNNIWFAFVPFLNYWLLCEMDNKGAGWFWTMLIFSFCLPFITVVMMILILMDVAEEMGFASWWGILALVPIFNIYVFYKLAFTGPLSERRITG